MRGGEEMDDRQSPSPPTLQPPTTANTRRHSVVSRVNEEFPVKLSSIHQSASESSIPRASSVVKQQAPTKQQIRATSHSSELFFSF